MVFPIVVCRQFVTNSSSGQNNSNGTTESNTNASKCLNLDDDERIQESLISSKNYYNIFQANYPSIAIPLHVRITVQFNSSTTNGSSTLGPGLGTLKRYTWSKLCVYVASKFVSLHAMHVYSFGAICPQRRETEQFTLCPSSGTTLKKRG